MVKTSRRLMHHCWRDSRSVVLGGAALNTGRQQGVKVAVVYAFGKIDLIFLAYMGLCLIVRNYT